MLDALLSRSDRELMRRVTYVLAFVFVFTAGFCHLEKGYSQKFFAITGSAKWIWARYPMSSNEPLAFFATRDVELPANRAFTYLRICGDPEYTVWWNGRRLVSRRARGEQRVLDLIDVSALARTGRNRIVVAVRAPQGFGGLIASVDLGPERAAWVATDDSWKIYRRWRPELLTRELPAEAEPPMVIGEPPVGRWDYLSAAPRAVETEAETAIGPRHSYRAAANVPEIRTVEGIAVAVATRKTGSVFDFGFTRGRVRLTVDRPSLGSRSISIRYANDAGELGRSDWNLHPVVFAPGERVVTAAEENSFRYVMVFGRNVRAEVVQ